MMENSFASEVSLVESSLPRIKKELDQFEEVLKRAEAGKCDSAFLSEKYHSMMLSTKDLTPHLEVLRRVINNPISNQQAAFQARSLHDATMKQIDRLQKAGVRVRKLTTTPVTAALGFSEATQQNLDVFGDIPSQAQMHKEDEIDEATARDMQRLEADILQVNEIFTTMATHVQNQGEIVDSIEANVEHAYQHVSSGNDQLASAYRHKRQVRRRKIICCGVLVGAIVLLIVILAIVYGSRKD